MGKVIGKVIATEKNPSTIDDFYFWTKQDLILNPFDVVKVNHLQHSVSYGVIEEISHITDTANFLADYVSNDFGDVDATENTHRIGMNYVKAKVIRAGLGRRRLPASIQKTGVGCIQLAPHKRRSIGDHPRAVPISHAGTGNCCTPSDPGSQTG